MYNVIVYDLVKNEGDVKIGRWFRAREFRCFDGCKQVFVSPRLVTLLDALRDNMGCPIIVNSGYRTPSHNKAIGGALNSMHLYGCAADIKPANGDLEKLYKLAAERLDKFGGLGKYDGFIHVDVRDTRTRWNG